MATNPEKGLFLVNNLKPLGEKPLQAHCRIQAAAVYTVHKPARNRLISYKVIYWDKKPETAEDYATFKQYTCPTTKLVVFLLNKNFAQMTAAEVEMACVRHFLETVLISYQPRRLKDALSRLQEKKDEVSFRIGANSGQRLGVWNVLHVQRLEGVEGLPMEPVSQTISYRANVYNDANEPLKNWVYGEDQFITFDSIYEGYQKLQGKAFEHFDDPAIMAGCDFHFGK